MRKQHVRWAASGTSPGNALWGRRWSQWAGLALAWALSVVWSGDARAGLIVSNLGDGTLSQVGNGGGAATLFASGFSNPSGLAFDHAGNLYVANSNTNSVLEVGPGGVVTTFATGFAAPQGIVFDSAGNL
jgi:hypothetical protein